MRKPEIIQFEVCEITAYAEGNQDTNQSYCAIVRGNYQARDEFFGRVSEVAYVPAVFEHWKQARKLYGETVTCRLVGDRYVVEM